MTSLDNDTDEKFNAKAEYDAVVKWLRLEFEYTKKDKAYVVHTHDFKADNSMLCAKMLADAIGNENVSVIYILNDIKLEEYCSITSINGINPPVMQLKLAYRNNMNKCRPGGHYDVKPLIYAIARSIANDGLLCVPHTYYEEVNGLINIPSYKLADIAPLLSYTPVQIAKMQGLVGIQGRDLAPREVGFKSGAVNHNILRMILSPIQYVP